VAVLTLARTRVTQLPRFLRASARAAAPLAGAPGMIWATALARPPVVATFSLWSSAQAAADYAYLDGGGHRKAMEADRSKAFHHDGAFVRFLPYQSAGHLEGRNPLRADSMSEAT
jgi:hypothetical protein